MGIPEVAVALVAVSVACEVAIAIAVAALYGELRRLRQLLEELVDIGVPVREI